MIMAHATCVAFEGKGVLLRGPSGCGKSDLALRAIAEGARLIADDYVELDLTDGEVVATAPQALGGMIEIRGLGLLRIEAQTRAPVALVVDLVAPETIERLPEERRCELLGSSIPWIALAPFEASAVAKVRYALLAAADPGRLVP